jgi:hypothetical protein
MARDLYGELLSNALNRKAPRDHFAAYINPREAAMLRSQGGGVAPGGGQYMASGIPSFQGMIGPGEEPNVWGGQMSDGVWEGPSGVPGRAWEGFSGQSAQETKDYDKGFLSEYEDASLDLEREAQKSLVSQFESAYKAAADAKAKGITNDRLQELNRARIEAENLAFPNQWSRGDLVAEYAKDIPKGGIGKHSPGTKMAEQDAPAHLIAHVNQQSASGGYAVNDPSRRDVSVPKPYHMGFVPAAMTSLIGAMSPLASLMTAPGQGLMGYIGDSLEEDTGPLGTATRGLGSIRTEIADVLSPVTDSFNALGTGAGNLVSQGAERLGNFLQSNIGSGDPVVEDSGALSRSMAGLPEGGFDPPFVPPQPEPVPYAGGFPSVIGSGEIQQGEKEVVGGVSEEILARLEANAAAGRRRIEEAERRRGMIA